MQSLLPAIRTGLFAAALTASVASNAALIEFTSRAAFDAATSNQAIEPNIAPPGSFYVLNNLDYNGFIYPNFAYMVDPAYAPALYEWGTGPVLLLASQSSLSFAPITAFAADFGTLPEGFSLTVTIDGVSMTLPTPPQRQLTFYGWTSDTPFTSVAFSTNAQYLILDNATRATADAPPAAVVSEPGSLAMIGLGVLAIAARRNRTKR